MQEKKAQPTLSQQEIEIIQLLYGLGAPSGNGFTALEPRVSEAEVQRIEAQALRKLRHMKLENLSQLRRAG